MSLLSSINDTEINGLAVNQSDDFVRLMVGFWEDSVVPWPLLFRDEDQGTVICVPYEDRELSVEDEGREMTVRAEDRTMEVSAESRVMQVAGDIDKCRD